MTKRPETDPLALYRNLMEEAKARLIWIEFAVQGKAFLAPQLVREFGFLQLRMICETIALGCLVAHGDLEATKAQKFQGSNSANDILRGLEKLKPGFYPLPLLPAVTQPATGLKHYPERESGFMTKEGLLTLYGKTCGSHLHRGSLKNLLRAGQPIQKHFPELMGPAQLISNLLAIHRIEIGNGDTQMLCFLCPPGQPVQAATAEALPPNEATTWLETFEAGGGRS